MFLYQNPAMIMASFDLSTVLSGAIASIAISLIIILVVNYIIKKPNPQQSLRGVLYDERGFASLTHFQFLFWTIVFLFSILWVYLVRIQGDVLSPPPTIPTNTLVLMGINTASTVASKAISKVRYSSLTPPTSRQSLSMMLYEGPTVSLARVQLFVWTLVSILIYFAVLFTLMFGPFLLAFSLQPLQTLSIPDVDPSLVTLMGLSHTAYLGRKFYTGSGQP